MNPAGFFQFVILSVLTTGIVLLVVINLQALELQRMNIVKTTSTINRFISERNTQNSFIATEQSVQVNKEEVREVLNPPFECENKKLVRWLEQRGQFYVYYNYVIAEKQFLCHESVTYTTQADFTFLDNLVTLTEAWKGPISVTLYAPGDDFQRTLKSIAYLRNCETPLIREFVTFHLFFEKIFIPKKLKIPLNNADEIYEDDYDCSTVPPFKQIRHEEIFKTLNNLTYPINVARNSARLASQTYYVFASDIELIPPLNFIPKFLDLVQREQEILANIPRKIFVLPIFEVLETAKVPKSKTELLRMLKNSTAFLFHEKLCRRCHEVQNYTEWLNTPESNLLNVLAIGTRTNAYKSLEAFYVGTNDEPQFDERLTWEGQKNKMTQAYAMCLLDYQYLILDNAFLVHKPGIKKEKVQMSIFSPLVHDTYLLVKHFIVSELRALYGKRAGC
ncbi:beta-1,4-glucuronyltransferase 1-like [Agrilus planipennis]|uniref:Beta-1,4-glucuronyltransferase 1-like n=1 Tax=Agrilus planipennis TaxID=224129 RepID=A0A1W4WBE8_AGRPL|nr:beta-1,4-glucuronyltransferase 1-like [Agrilus planipennis]